MLYSFTVRRAVAADSEAVHAIIQTGFAEYARHAGLRSVEALSETVEDIRKEIAQKAVYVAEIDGTIAGTVRLDIHGEEAYLSRFAVSVETRNLGIGKSLMNVVDKYLMGCGVTRVVLHTASRHYALVRFYYSRGFYIEAVETDRGYLRARMVKEYPAAGAAN